MTGLDISKDHLIEIAVLITDGDLNIVAEVNDYWDLRQGKIKLWLWENWKKGPELVIHQPKEVMDNMNGKTKEKERTTNEWMLDVDISRVDWCKEHHGAVSYWSSTSTSVHDKFKTMSFLVRADTGCSWFQSLHGRCKETDTGVPKSSHWKGRSSSRWKLGACW